MTESERVLAWRAENRLRYNAYMRELRRKNPEIQKRDNARRREARARKREEQE